MMATYKSIAETPRAPKAPARKGGAKGESGCGGGSSNVFSHSKKYCNNCGQMGHIYKDCSRPITSFGVICFDAVERGDSGAGDARPPLPPPAELAALTPYSAAAHPDLVAAMDARFRFLMIRRKDSLGFVDFMRGRYNLHNRQHIRNLIDEMTLDEKHRLRTQPFHDLWRELWGRTWFNKFKQEEATSSSKLAALKRGVYNDRVMYTLDSLIEESATSWEEPEWEFPKGRRNNSEYDVTAALREFGEETGVHKQRVAMVRNLDPFIENYTGSNFKAYKNVYYLARYVGAAGEGGDGGEDGDRFFSRPQQEEVSKIRWCSFSECLRRIRPYCHKKKEILSAVALTLLQYSVVDAAI